MKILVFVVEIVLLIALLYGIYVLSTSKKTPKVKKSSAIIPKVGSTVVMNGGYEGLVVGYKDDKIVVEVTIDIDDISR